MRRETFISTAVLVAAFAMVIFGQTPPGAARRMPLSVELPKGDSAWAVRVVRTGGLTGGNSGDVTITSDGNVVVDLGDSKLKTKLSSDELKSLSQLISSAQLSNMTSTESVACLDCNKTAVTLRRRVPKGKEQTYSADWNPVTAANVPPDFIRIVQSVWANVGF